MFIIDIGSGNTLRTTEEACKIIKIIKDMNISDSYVKFQLFKKEGNNIPLNLEIFERATRYANVIRMPYGVSVFDEDSLNTAIYSGALCFLKLANRSDLLYLVDKAPKEDKWIISTDNLNLKVDRHNTEIIYCISKYPATEKEYEQKFGDKLKQGFSDHTINFNLFKKYQPKIYECHFRLPETTGNDAGKFARLPEQFKEVLNMSASVDDFVKDEIEKAQKENKFDE